MTLIRRDALVQTGQWGEWCIVEDAELGMRLLEAGWESVYVNHSFGHGLSPDSFSGFKRQRFRWAYGAVQILKRHWRALLPWDKSTKLTGAQRYHFVMGWLPWFADALSVVLAVLGLVWTAGLLIAPKYFDFPLSIFLAPTIAVFAFKLIRFFWLYSAKVKCDVGDCVRAGVAGLALTYTIGYAMLAGLFTKKLPFHRTPKMEDKPALVQALAMARDRGDHAGAAGRGRPRHRAALRHAGPRGLGLVGDAVRAGDALRGGRLHRGARRAAQGRHLQPPAQAGDRQPGRPLVRRGRRPPRSHRGHRAKEGPPRRGGPFRFRPPECRKARDGCRGPPGGLPPRSGRAGSKSGVTGELVDLVLDPELLALQFGQHGIVGMRAVGPRRRGDVPGWNADGEARRSDQE
jgi:hypothetical protein